MLYAISNSNFTAMADPASEVKDIPLKSIAPAHVWDFIEREHNCYRCGSRLFITIYYGKGDERMGFQVSSPLEKFPETIKEIPDYNYVCISINNNKMYEKDGDKVVVDDIARQIDWLLKQKW